MSGSLFSAAATFIVGILALVLVGAGFIWVLPILLLALVPLLAGTTFRKMRNSSVVQDEPSGIPSTRDAAYAPQSDPSARAH